LLHDRIDVGGRTVDCGKTRIRFVEDKVKVSAGQYDCLNAIAPAEGMRQFSQPCLIVG
jgi:hypothetical protein